MDCACLMATTTARMATTTARVTPVTHNPSISAQTVCNRLREAGLRACRPVVRLVLTRHHRKQRRLWAQTHWSLWCSSLTSHSFLSPGVMVRFEFIIEGMSITPRPVLWRGINFEVEDQSWSGVVCHCIWVSLLSLQAIPTLCDTGKTSSSIIWYPSCRLILTWPSSMTMPPAILLILGMISCKTGMWVFCHGQRRAQILIPLSTSGTCWIGGGGLGPFPPGMSGKSGVSSHSKNWQIWCSPWGGDALQYLMELVATPDTDCYFWFFNVSPLFRDTLFNFW